MADTHLQLPGGEEEAGNSDGLGAVAHKDVCPQTVVHEVPTRQRRQTDTHTVNTATGEREEET